MKVAGLIGWTVASLALAGCSGPQQADEGVTTVEAATPLKITAGENHIMPPCPSDPDVKYTVTAVVPKNLNKLMKRSVKIKLGKSPKDDHTGGDNEGGSGNKHEPFHIFFHSDDVLQYESGYVLVRIFIKDGNGSNLVFHRDGPMNGVTSGIEGNVFCGNDHDPNGGDYKNNVKEVSYFYISIKEFLLKAPKSGNSVPFNIWVNVEGFGDTPIIIDPKVHNEA